MYNIHNIIYKLINLNNFFIKFLSINIKLQIWIYDVEEILILISAIIYFDVKLIETRLYLVK